MPGAEYNAEDLAWAAGLFEGEGFFTIRRLHLEGCRAAFAMGLTMTDQDVVERFADVVGCGHLYPHRMRHAKPHWKPQFTWGSSGKAAIAAATTLLPRLGKRRQERFHEIMALIEQSLPKPRPCERCGKFFTPTRFDRERFCSDPCRYRARYLRRRYGVGTQDALLVSGHPTDSYVPGSDEHIEEMTG